MVVALCHDETVGWWSSSVEGRLWRWAGLLEAEGGEPGVDIGKVEVGVTGAVGGQGVAGLLGEYAGSCAFVSLDPRSAGEHEAGFGEWLRRYGGRVVRWRDGPLEVECYGSSAVRVGGST